METIIGTAVGIWFVAQVWLTGAAVVLWLGWVFTRLMSVEKVKGETKGASNNEI